MKTVLQQMPSIIVVNNTVTLSLAYSKFEITLC